MPPRASLTLDYATKEWKDARTPLIRDLESIKIAINQMFGLVFDDDNVLVHDAFDPSTPTSIELTGDVVAGPGVSPQAATIQPNAVTGPKILNNAVSYSKMQDVSAASRLIGRGSAAGSGDPQEISLGASLTMSGTTLSATSGGSGINQLTGDVTAGPGTGSQAATIPNNTVTFAKMQDIATQRAIGRNTAGTGDPEEVTISQMLDWTP